jgi:hypothetical protein
VSAHHLEVLTLRVFERKLRPGGGDGLGSTSKRTCFSTTVVPGIEEVLRRVGSEMGERDGTRWKNAMEERDGETRWKNEMEERDEIEQLK